MPQLPSPDIFLWKGWEFLAEIIPPARSKFLIAFFKRYGTIGDGSKHNLHLEVYYTWLVRLVTPAFPAALARAPAPSVRSPWATTTWSSTPAPASTAALAREPAPWARFPLSNDGKIKLPASRLEAGSFLSAAQAFRAGRLPSSFCQFFLLHAGFFVRPLVKTLILCKF